MPTIIKTSEIVCAHGIRESINKSLSLFQKQSSIEKRIHEKYFWS